MANTKGLIVYFDGPDGAGKTTQLELLASALIAEGQTVHQTRSVGGTPIGELLREASLSDNERPVATDLYIALACQNALAVDVNARREQGKVVLVDRSPLSIVAYQVFGDGLASEIGYNAAQQLMDLIKPDLTIVYLADSQALESRRMDRNVHQDYFESKPLDYHQRVAEGFKEAAQRFDAKIMDATQDVDSLQAQTVELVKAVINA